MTETGKPVTTTRHCCPASGVLKKSQCPVNRWMEKTSPANRICGKISLVFPGILPLRDAAEIRVGQHGLDARGSQLDAQRGMDRLAHRETLPYGMERRIVFAYGIKSAWNCPIPAFRIPENLAGTGRISERFPGHNISMKSTSFSRFSGWGLTSAAKHC